MEKMKIDRKELILNAFADLVAMKGIDKTSLSMVAAAAKIPSSLIFYYFKNKQDMIDHLWDYTLNTYRDSFFSGQKLGDELDFVRLIQQAFLLHPYMNINHHSLQHVFSCMQFYVAIDKPLRAKYLEFVEGDLREYERFFDYYNSKGIIQIEDTRKIARQFECIFLSANTIWAIYYKNGYDEWATSSMESFCNAVGCSAELLTFLMKTYAAERAYQLATFGF